MEKTRRTPEEMERDYREIKQIAKKAKTMKEIQETMDLSYGELRTTLAKYTGAEKKIKEQLEKNRQKAKEKRKAKPKQTPVKPKQKKEERIEETKQETVENKKKEEATTENKNIVIDVSITGLKEFEEIFSQIMKSKQKVILTSTTISELEKMQTFNDLKAVHARYILGTAAENNEKFENILIDETKGTPDECIIYYCAQHNKEVNLFTSDKTMTLKARMYSVQVTYFKQEPKKEANNANKKQEPIIKTLFAANKIGNKLIVTEFHTPNRSLSIFSDNEEYLGGVRELKIGDDVFIATQKIDYVAFAHYQMISLEKVNNCRLIFSKRIYDKEECKLLKEEYQTFLNNFMEKHQ